MTQDDAIRQIAHQLWEADGRPEGRAAEHWSKAERIFKEQESVGAGAAGLAGNAPSPKSAATAKAPARKTVRRFKTP